MSQFKIAILVHLIGSDSEQCLPCKAFKKKLKKNAIISYRNCFLGISTNCVLSIGRKGNKKFFLR